MQQPSPVSMGSTPIRLREVILLLIGGGMALFMLDEANLGVLLGWLAVIAWAYALIVGPRQSLAIGFVVGAAAFVMTFWWPDEGWVWMAIPLLWASMVILVGCAVAYVYRIVRR